MQQQPLTAAPQGRDRCATRSRRSTRLGVLAAVGASLVALQVGTATVASAESAYEFSSSGSTEGEARSNFYSNAKTVCQGHGDFRGSTLLDVSKINNHYTAEGYATCSW